MNSVVFVLIIAIFRGGVGVHELNTESECNYAAASVKKDYSYLTEITAICVPKTKE